MGKWLVYALKAVGILVLFVVLAVVFLALWVALVQPLTSPLLATLSDYGQTAFFYAVALPVIAVIDTARYVFFAFPLLGWLALALWVGAALGLPLVGALVPEARFKEQNERSGAPHRDAQLGDCFWNYPLPPRGDDAPLTLAYYGRQDANTRVYVPTAFAIRSWDEGRLAFAEWLVRPANNTGVMFFRHTAYKYGSPLGMFTGFVFDEVADVLSEAASADVIGKSIVGGGGEGAADEVKKREPGYDPRADYSEVWIHVVLNSQLEPFTFSVKLLDHVPAHPDMGLEKLDAEMRLHLGMLLRLQDEFRVDLIEWDDIGEVTHLLQLPGPKPRRPSPVGTQQRHFRIDSAGNVQEFTGSVHELGHKVLRHCAAAAAGMALVWGGYAYLHDTYAPPPLHAPAEERADAWARLTLRLEAALDATYKYPYTKGISYPDAHAPVTLRAEPDPAATQLVTLAPAAPVFVFASKDGWSYVRQGDSYGWTRDAQLQDARPVASAPASPSREWAAEVSTATTPKAAEAPQAVPVPQPKPAPVAAAPASPAPGAAAKPPAAKQQVAVAAPPKPPSTKAQFGAVAWGMADGAPAAWVTFNEPTASAARNKVMHNCDQYGAGCAVVAEFGADERNCAAVARSGELLFVTTGAARKATDAAALAQCRAEAQGCIIWHSVCNQ